MNRYHTDDTINLAYEILYKHMPYINDPHDDFDELIDFYVVEAMMEFLNTVNKTNERNQRDDV